MTSSKRTFVVATGLWPVDPSRWCPHQEETARRAVATVAAALGDDLLNRRYNRARRRCYSPVDLHLRAGRPTGDDISSIWFSTSRV
jgi:hypothetical protein